MTNPEHLAETDAAELKEIRTACPELDAPARHVRHFATMMCDHRSNLLAAWLDRVLADDLPVLHSLVNGLRRDIDAVTAAFSTSWSSGQVEGHVTRVKLLKRMGFGRANLDLLRRRVLHSPWDRPTMQVHCYRPPRDSRRGNPGLDTAGFRSSRATVARLRV